MVGGVAPRDLPYAPLGIRSELHSPGALSSGCLVLIIIGVMRKVDGDSTIIAVPACVPPAVTVQQPVVQQPGQTIIVQQGGGRAHKYDASVLSGAWTMDNEACPGCCPWQVNIMAMGQDAFQFGPSKVMFTRDGGTDNFRSQRGAQGESGPCMALVLSENDIKLRGNENFTLTKNNRTNLVDRA